ncbi:IS256 family transposase, partial [Myroides sp. LJL116]
MDTKKIISDEVFKGLKTKEDLTSFFKYLQKRAIECMLEGELNAHLDYDKHDLRKDQNARNGYTTKTIK